MLRFPLLAASVLLLFSAACRPYGPVVPGTAPVPASAPAPVEEPSGESAAVAALRERAIVIPVAGVGSERIHDSFDEGRSGERRHNAIDIMAPRGTPVLSADSGRILRLSTNRLGGITVYATDPGERFVYYYAHLDGYAEGLFAGKNIARGDTLGFVGTTGNAPKDLPHLHFQVMRMPEDRKGYWNGEPINPFPVLASLPRSDSEAVVQAGRPAGHAGAGAKSPRRR